MCDQPGSATAEEMLRRAVDAFNSTVRGTASDQFARPTINEGWTVRDVINHVLDSEQWAMAMIATGEGDFMMTDFLGDNDPATVVARTGTSLLSVVRGHADTPGEHAFDLSVTVLELMGHGWDIAVATAQPVDLAPDVADWCLTRAREQMDQPEARGEFFKPAVPISETASAADRLAAYLGKPVAPSR